MLVKKKRVADSTCGQELFGFSALMGSQQVELSSEKQIVSKFLVYITWYALSVNIKVTFLWKRDPMDLFKSRM